MTGPSRQTQARKNARLAMACGLIFCCMVGAAFAAVPLYKKFCQATGFGGEVKRASVAPKLVIDKTVTISFDTNVRDLPWTFTSEEPRHTVKLGDTALTVFKVTNNGKTATTGRASYNVSPSQAGAYLSKIECFCFSNQTIQPGQTVEFPVVFFIDAAYASDFETRDTSDITLSYTFFPVKEVANAAGTDAKGG
ncbi:MAG: cytochrome c oxidase assembly protein [Caulobacteraceae bacterium]|nr:cytochrome c oxidase assembly protein [Caulobacteraceae bacterium]